MNNLAQYNAVRTQLRPGDLVMFWGRKPLPLLIELFGAGPSHCAIVRQSVHQGSDVLISESTRPFILEKGDRNGVQTNPLGTVISTEYAPGGQAAGLRLSQASRGRIDWEKFYAWLGACDGHVAYDVDGLFEFLLRDIPVIGARVAQGEKLDAMVCSAFVCSTLTRCGLLCGVNWTKCTPQDLVEMGIYENSAPLLGNPKLSRFNTV